MRKLPIILTILAIGLTFIPFNTKADGGVFPRPNYWVRESGQKAVIFYEKGRETLILSITFKGDAKDFGWVIPVPQKPEVTKGSDEIFTSLQEITQKYKRYGYENVLMAPMMSGARLEAPLVTVIETKKIDYYDITVLSATDAQALTKWLSDNGYQYPEESAYILNDYIDNQWYFVAVKISPEVEGAKEVVKGLKEGHATPLKIEFDSEAIIYPLRISAIEVSQGLIKLSDNLVLNQARIKHLKNIGYGDLTDKEKGPKIFNQIVQDVLSKKNYNESVASKYPFIISKNDYSNDYSKVSCFNVRECQNRVERWFDNYFSQEGLYYNLYQANYIPIALYVIADGKKEIPGFTTNYANWIEAKDIRKLAYDVNGKPLINPQGKKYYLTSLYRNMTTQEMTHDLVIRDAENNKRVNAPNPWTNLLWGCLIVLGIVFFGIFSPLGLIFIVGSLLRGLVKLRAVKIVGRICQLFSLIITLGLFVLFIILAIKFRAIPGVSIWTVSPLIGLALLVGGQIATLIIQHKLAK